MAAKFELKLRNAIKSNTVAGAALYAVNHQGTELINKAFGKAGIGDHAKDMTMDTVFWLASSTKLLTSISALQLVEAGKLSLTKPVDDILPEFANPEVLVGFEEGTDQPILRPSSRPITLAHLLTHSSGLSYDSFHPKLLKYREVMGLGPAGNPDGKPMLEAFVTKLLFEPGESWEYGCSTDFAGLMVERVSGLSLEEYMKKNIFQRLGMKDTTFHPLSRPDLLERMHGRVMRGEDGKAHDDKDGTLFRLQEHGFEGGGSGLYSTSSDYAKVLMSLIKEDEKLLKQETVTKYLQKGQLEENAKVKMQQSFRDEILGPLYSVGEHREKEMGLRWDHGFGSSLTLTGMKDEYEAGMMHWGGAANNNWWIDPKKGLAGFYGTWIIPIGDQPTGDLFGDFRRSMFQEAENKAHL